MSKTIAIVGAGPGVGLAVAERFGREGFQVALLARSLDKLDGLVHKLAELGVEAAAFVADVLDREGLTAALQRVVSRFGSIDVLEYGPLPDLKAMCGPRDIDAENTQLHLDHQVLGAITAVRAVLPSMVERRAGSLLFTTAVSAQHPLAMTASFGVAAGAFLNYARLLHSDLVADGVFAGIVSIAAVVVPGNDAEIEYAAQFPPGMPLIRAREVADLHWDLHLERDRCEVFAGDPERFLGVPGIR